MGYVESLQFDLLHPDIMCVVQVCLCVTPVKVEKISELAPSVQQLVSAMYTVTPECS